MFLYSFLSGFFSPLICYAHFAEKVHPLRNALIRYGVTFDNNVANLVTLGSLPDPNTYYRTILQSKTTASFCIYVVEPSHTERCA